MSADAVHDIAAFIVTIPRETPYLGVLGPGARVNERGYFVRARNRTVYPVMDRSILVRVTTRSGAIGWGETYGLIAPRATTEILLDLFAPFVIGRDPHDAAVIHDELRDLMRVRGCAGGYYGDALAAIDIALWDLSAKLAGKSLAQHLGGRRRDTIAAYVSGLPEPTLAARVKLATGFAARGFRNFKFAAAVSECGETEELSSLREALGPDAGIAVDLHWQYTPAEALSLAHRLAPDRPLFIEAPVSPDDVAGLREVCTHSPVPVAAGEEWFSGHEFRTRLPGPAILQPEMGHTGITEFLRIAELARERGLRLMPHATIGLGIFLAASLQACASLEVETLHEYQHSVFDANLRYLQGDIHMAGIEYAVPDAAGLGVSPDDAVWEHAVEIRLT